MIHSTLTHSVNIWEKNVLLLIGKGDATRVLSPILWVSLGKEDD